MTNLSAILAIFALCPPIFALRNPIFAPGIPKNDKFECNFGDFCPLDPDFCPPKPEKVEGKNHF